MINEDTARMREILTEVAGMMPGTWTLEPMHDHGARFVNADGVRIWARLETYGANAGKVDLTAGMPDEANYSAGDYGREKTPEIRVSLERPPAVLARDIARRIVPAAIAHWDAVSGRIAARVAANNAREILARDLAGIMGTTAREWRNEWQANVPDVSHESADGHRRCLYGHFSADYDGTSAQLELRGMTPAQAREVAALVATWRGVA